MKNRISHFVLLFACLICLFLCVAVSASADSTTAIWPQQTTVTNSGGSLLVDASGAPNGYFFAAISYNTSHRLKLRVIKDGTTFTYDLKTDASYELFPLQLGTGYYEIHLYENISGKKYAMAGSIGLYVTMENQEAAFLVPNQYINYTRASEAVAKADELCASKGGKDAYDSVCKFMTSSFVYDFIKAVTIKPSMLPDIDGSYAKKMGICQDLAAHIITIEDPIEYLHRHKKSLVSQREVPNDAATFSRALRAALRQAPDVVLLGEKRDLDTIRTAITAAETGHLLLSTLHTIGAAKTVDRIVDTFPAEQQAQIRVQLSMVLRAVVSQRLVPTKDGGRVPVFELMTVNPAIQNMIRDSRTHQIDNVIFGGSDKSMISMDAELQRLVREGTITRDMALLHAVNPETLAKRI